ncbi:MAG: NifU family protein [Crocinitomicaceae bacterium TMED114]|nr:MAG: NifU family protein [Crocinitomicaceae bacterium TMED114]|tara:strand:+ start:88 stop:363 length:276 start_codon:yes stop_codon:yes gene_type:complete
MAQAHQDQEALRERIDRALDELRPFLRSDGGDITVMAVKEDLTVEVELQGACAHCAQAAMTMRAGVEEAVRRAVPEVTQVVAVNMPASAQA